MESNRGEFCPDRLDLAMKIRGVDVQSLASGLDVSRKSIGNYLAGRRVPSNELVRELANQLSLPEEFLRSDFPPEVRTTTISFRSLARMRARTRNAAQATATLAIELADWLDRSFTLPEPSIPSIAPMSEPAVAAGVVRQMWGWGEKPIPNMVHLLESKGVKVFSSTIKDEDVDAYSMWYEDTPFCFLNVGKSGERARFDAAHELGHLVLHKDGAIDSRLAEHEANAFASAFLMPEDHVRSKLPNHPTLDQLRMFKNVWGVSVAALAYRAHALGILTDWEYRTINIEISQLGWRKTEPDPIKRESSLVFQKLLSNSERPGELRRRMASSIKVGTDILDELTYGLTLTSIVGSKTHGMASTKQEGANYLKVVQNRK